MAVGEHPGGAGDGGSGVSVTSPCRVASLHLGLGPLLLPPRRRPRNAGRPSEGGCARWDRDAFGERWERLRAFGVPYCVLLRGLFQSAIYF